MLRPARSACLIAFLACALATVLAPVAAAQQAATSTRPLTYVAIGASDTLGVGATDPERDGWVPRFARQLGPSTHVVNLGVPGSLVHHALDAQLPAAIAANPDVVTIWLAVNDFDALVPLDIYTAHLDTLLKSLRANTRARIVVGNIPDLALLLRSDLDPLVLQLVRAFVTRWNVAIGAVVQQNGATLVDLYGAGSEWREHPEYVSSDGFHPSSDGYARLSDLFYTAYSSASAQP